MEASLATRSPFTLHGHHAVQPRAQTERPLVLRAVLLAEVALVTGRVAKEQLAGVDAVLVHELERARCGDDVSQREQEAAAHAVVRRGAVPEGRDSR
jgi:hypothetical protein